MGHGPPLYASSPLRVGEDEFAQILLGSQFHVRSASTGEQTRSVNFNAHVSIFTPWTASPDYTLLACAVGNHVRVYDLTAPGLKMVTGIDNGDGHHFTGLASTRPGGFWRPRRTMKR